MFAAVLTACPNVITTDEPEAEYDFTQADFAGVWEKDENNTITIYLAANLIVYVFNGMQNQGIIIGWTTLKNPEPEIQKIYPAGFIIDFIMNVPGTGTDVKASIPLCMNRDKTAIVNAAYPELVYMKRTETIAGFIANVSVNLQGYPCKKFFTRSIS
jgi:hypothetical protein